MITAYIDTYNDGNFRLVDLGETDIIMKYTLVDLQDISKVFAPYSLDLTLPPTDNNKIALDWFGYNDLVVSSPNTDFRFPIKIYVDDNLHLNGYFTCRGLSSDGNFTGKFETGLGSLKDRIGEDLISQLPYTFPIEWNGEKVRQYMSASQNTVSEGIDFTYFVPFSSNSRFWFRDQNLATNTTNNIAYINSEYNNETAINTTEVSPAISYYAVLLAIFKRYGLNVLVSPTTEPILKDMFLYCTGTKTVTNVDFNKILITVPFNVVGAAPDWQLNYKPHTYQTSGGTLTDPYLRVEYRPLSDNQLGIQYKSENEFIGVQVNFANVVTSTTNDITIVLRNLDGVDITTPITVKKDTNNNILCNLKILDTTFQSLGETAQTVGYSKQFKFNIFVKSVEPISWNRCEFIMEYSGVKTTGGGIIYKGWQSLTNDNFSSFKTNVSKINLLKALPKMKVADFLTSFFKMFNISVFDNDPTNDNLQMLTPTDIDTIDLEYSKLEADYTDFVIDKKVEKSKQDDYDSYSFKHAKSKLLQNDQFEAAYGQEFGALYYPTLAERKLKKINKELKIETNHTITGNVSINGIANAFTFYGFDSSINPVDEPLIFFVERNGSNIVAKDISSQKVAVQNIKANGTAESLALSQYIPVNPDRKINGLVQESLTFGGTTLTNLSLYKIGYEDFVLRLLDFKAIEHKFKLQLPRNELYLNGEYERSTPVGFRLQNDIIIGENKFSIVNAEINYKNGLTNLTLYNYTANT